MADMSTPVKGAAYDLYFTLYKNDGTVIANPGTYTKKVSKDGGAVADCANSVTEVDTTYGECKLTLSTTEMNADAVWVQIKDDTTGCVPFTATLYPCAALQTGDAFARLGAPAGASHAADVAAVAAKTTNLPASPAAVSDVPTAAANATAVWGAGTKALTDKAGFSLAADQAVNVTKVNGTAQTAGDLAALVGDMHATDLPAVKTVVDAVKAKTDNLPASPAATGAAMTLTSAYDHAKDDVYGRVGAPSGASIAADIATRLAAAGYTAPDNATVAAIAGYVDTEVAAILAAVDTEVAAIKAKTDNLPSDPADESLLIAAIAAVPAAPAAATVASAVRTELGTELGRIDAAVSSRLATSGYTAPSNASIASVLAIAQKLDTAFELDGAVYRFTANALEQAPTGSGSGTTAQQVWEYATRTLSDKAGFALTSAYDPAKSAASAAAVSALGSPMQASTYAAPDNAGIAAVKAKTDALPSVPASKADADAATSAANAAKASADLANRTAPANSDVAAIKAKTDNLPAAPADGADLLTPADVRSAVWDDFTMYHGVDGTTGKALVDAATEANATANKEAVIAAMPELGEVTAVVDLTPVTDVLEPMEAKLLALGAGGVTVLSPVTSDGDLTISAGDDYLAADGRSVDFSFPKANLPTLAGGTVKLKARSFSWTAARITSNHDAWLVSFDLTAEQTIHASPSGFELEATTADGHVVTLSTGTLKVKVDRPAVN